MSSLGKWQWVTEDLLTKWVGGGVLEGMGEGTGGEGWGYWRGWVRVLEGMGEGTGGDG